MTPEQKAEILLKEYKTNLPVLKECNNIYNTSEERAYLILNGHDQSTCIYEIFWDHERKEIDKLLEGNKILFQNDKQHRSEVNSRAGKLYGLANWVDCGKVVYDLDPDLAYKLKEDARELDTEERISTDILSYLPYPGMFLSTPSMKLLGQYYMDGVFITLGPVIDHNDGSISEHRAIHFIAVMFEDNVIRQCFSIAVPIIPNASLQDMLDEITTKTNIVRGEEDDARTRRTRRVVKIFFELLLYVCSENAKIRERIVQEKKNIPSYGYTIKKIGEEDGIRIRQLKDYVIVNPGPVKDHSGRTMPPHERRAHWHSYWVGKKNSTERRLILKWILPMIIHKEELEKAKPTIVQEGSAKYEGL